MKKPNPKTVDTANYSIEAQEDNYLYIKQSQIQNAGSGLYTAINIYKNEIIALFKGEIITNEEAEKRAKKNNDRYFINLLDGSIMDSMHTDCFAKYANDTNGSINSDFNNNAEITLDDDDKVCIKATKKIKAGNEVFCSYGKPYWKKHN